MPSHAGGRSSTLAHVTAECKNCGVTLAGAYCSACGQAADVRIPSFGRVAADALGDLYSFDSRMWRTVLTLIREPGRLTSRYVDGQRAQFTPPFRLYAASTVAFFLLFSLARLGVEPEEAAVVTEEPEATAPAEAEDTFTPPEVEENTIFLTTDDGGWSCNLVDEDTNPALRERLEAACEKIERDTGASFARALRDNLPVMMLVFIPLVAALMRVLYLFAHRKYVEHLVFFLHVHALFFLVAIVVVVLGRVVDFVPFLRWPVILVNLAAWVYFPVYLYRAMRHVYRQSHALTAVKYVLLGGGYVVALLTTLFGLVIVTAATL